MTKMLMEDRGMVIEFPDNMTEQEIDKVLSTRYNPAEKDHFAENQKVTRGIWDKFYSGAADIGQQSKDAFLSVLPDTIWQEPVFHDAPFGLKRMELPIVSAIPGLAGDVLVQV